MNLKIQIQNLELSQMNKKLEYHQTGNMMIQDQIQ